MTKALTPRAVANGSRPRLGTVAWRYTVGRDLAEFMPHGGDDAGAGAGGSALPRLAVVWNLI